MNKDFSNTTQTFDSQLLVAKGAFDSKFQRVFGDGWKDFVDEMPQSQQFAKEVLSNLLAGVSYFYGPIRI